MFFAVTRSVIQSKNYTLIEAPSLPLICIMSQIEPPPSTSINLNYVPDWGPFNFINLNYVPNWGPFIPLIWIMFFKLCFFQGPDFFSKINFVVAKSPETPQKCLWWLWSNCSWSNNNFLWKWPKAPFHFR